MDNVSEEILIEFKIVESFARFVYKRFEIKKLNYNQTIQIKITPQKLLFNN